MKRVPYSNKSLGDLFVIKRDLQLKIQEIKLKPTWDKLNGIDITYKDYVINHNKIDTLQFKLNKVNDLIIDRVSLNCKND